jgi:hypothetical protein
MEAVRSSEVLFIVIAATLPTASAGFFLEVLFGPDDGADSFLRNVGLSPNYTGLNLHGYTLHSQNLKSNELYLTVMHVNNGKYS